MFSMESVSLNPSIATFQLSSAASLNLRRSRNGVFGNWLNAIEKKFLFEREKNARNLNLSPSPTNFSRPIGTKFITESKFNLFADDKFCTLKVMEFFFEIKENSVR